ncbi:MAG: hypothetical protein DRJ62_00030 [Thermoprotei archaeon]|nr:MAG: hypothetical protein DRJ62_00030 [Thermoprotei archaeon]
MRNLSFEDGYEVAKLIAKGVDLPRLQRIYEVVKKAMECFKEEGDERDFMLGLVEGLGEISRLREDIARIINVAKSMGISIEVNIRYGEEV